LFTKPAEIPGFCEILAASCPQAYSLVRVQSVRLWWDEWWVWKDEDDAAHTD